MRQSNRGIERKRTERLELRLGPGEKEAFQSAAACSGISLSSWIRERLRKLAIIELEEAGKPVAFLGKHME